jgi:NAD(P)-dependent dehydrogenase (short-subunit alcohol dehydrogenase family)
VVPLEIDHCTVRVVDVQADHPDAAAQVIEEVRRAGSNETVARRGTARWQPLYEPIHITEKDRNGPAGISLRREGIYLITGGTGGMGLVLARHIARETQGLLVLTARTPVPAPEEWTGLLSSPDTAPALKAKIEGLQAILDAGGRVLTVEADAADSAAMLRIIAEVKQQYGAVHGVIHAAGIAIGRILQANTPEDVQAVLAPKVGVAAWVSECLSQPQLDFVLLCSSISALIPFVGQADYGAANAWMDAFAALHDNPAGTRVISVNWDTWRDVGMAANFALIAGLDEVRKQIMEQAIRPQEATGVFDRILATPMPQIAVSTRDLEQRRREENRPVSRLNSLIRTPGPGPAGPSSHRQPREAAKDEVEAAVIEVWEELLGVPVGPRDNFFELGGHSLVGTQVLSRIRERFGVSLDVRTVFEAVTPADMAERIRLMCWAMNPVPDEVTAGRREEVEF